MNQKVKLSEVCDLQNGFAFKSNLFKKDGLPVIRITNINNQKVDTKGLVYFEPIDYQKKDFSQYKVFPGDLVIAMSGATTGKVGINTTEKIFYLNQRVGNLKPKSNLDKKYLFHLLSMKVNENLRNAMGVAQPNLSSKQIKDITLYLPPLNEQRRITKILDKVSSLVDKANKISFGTSEINASYFQQVFGDPISNEKNWEIGALSCFIDSFETGKSLRPASNKDSIGPKILKVSAVSSGKYLPSESKVLPRTLTIDPRWWVQNGDLLFCRANTRELVGTVAEVFNQDEARVLPDKIWRFIFLNKNKNMNPFFIDLFRHPSFRRELVKRASGTSGSMLNISKSSVLNLKTIIPPINLIDKYCQTIKLINSQIRAIDNSIKLLHNLENSIQMNLFKEGT